MQGANLTFLSCPNDFEIYQTNNIAISPYENIFYGELAPVTGAHPSLETTIKDRITWTYNQNEIWTAEDEGNGTVIMTKIMVLSLPLSAVIKQAWVFDSVIVVRF